MKKFISIVSAMLLVFGFAASALAIHAEIPSETQAVVAKGATQITLGGELRFRGETQQNMDFDDDMGGNKSYYDGRVRLRIQADVSKNTTGVVHLETGSGNTDTYEWGAAASENKGIYGEGNGKRGTLDVLEAWIQHKGSGLLGTPAGIKVGHMPLKLGNGLFFDHSKFGDDAIVFFMDPTKELHIGLLNAKFTEATNTKPDDTDAYVALFAYKGKDFNISGDITYLIDQNYSPKGLHFWNYGLRGDVKVGPVGIKADIELQSGKAKVDTGADTKFGGYAYLIGIDYKIGDITLDLAHALGSGDSDAGDNKVKTFVTALSGIQNYTYVYEYRAKTAGVIAPASGASTMGSTGSGLANTTYYKLGAAGKLAKDLSANLNLYLLRATKAISTNSTYNSKKIGTELDAKVTYTIDRNLVYFVEGGYLWAGDIYKNITANAKDPDNAYAVRHGIMLSF